jgi:endonuclease/exonuclease/phosphatase family metal-dependent hydrolase
VSALTVAAIVVVVVSSLAVADRDGSPAEGELRTVTVNEAAAVKPDIPEVGARDARRAEAADAEPLPVRALEKKKTKDKPPKRQLRKQAAEAEKAAKALTAASFRVASFNVLGSSHTAGTSRRAGFTSGAARMGMAVNYLRARAVDVVGFQEFEDSQYAAFAGMTAGEYAVWPGRALGPRSIRFSIAWRTSTWSLVDASSVAVPYAGGNYIQMPYVRLQHVASGREVYFANFHNPADTPRLGGNARWRGIATGIEIGLVNRLRAETGLPVVVTGDMNERAAYFCPMTTQTDLAAANGGSTGDACAPPPAMQVDWIFGSPEIVFSNYAADRAAPVPRITDHPVVQADGYLPPAP